MLILSHIQAQKMWKLRDFDLDVAIAEAKVKLKGKLGELPEEFRRDLGIDKKRYNKRCDKQVDRTDAVS